MCRDIINQIFQQSLKGITAFSVSSVCMLNRNINNTVRTPDQKVSNLWKLCICFYHGIHKESADQPVTGDLKIRIFSQHL